MNRHANLLKVLALGAVLASASLASAIDELRNVKRGEPVPAYRLPSVDGAVIDSEEYKDSLVVLIYLSAEQRSSELAAAESRDIVQKIADESVKLLHVTADVVHKPYFERFRQEREITVPLALDTDRALYGKLGLIVFPTTIIIDREGKLSHVISVHAPDYPHLLESYIRHTLGQLTDGELEERLRARPSSTGSPKSLASTHRAAARLLRDKGLLDAARDELTKALEKVPDDPDILLDLADLSLSTGDLDDVERLVETVLAANPEHRRAKQLKGIALYRRDRLDEAETVLLEALNLNPDPARIHYYLGCIYEHKAEQAKALEHYHEALRRLLKEPGAS